MKITLSQTPKWETDIRFFSMRDRKLPRDFKAEKGEVAVRYRHQGTTIYVGLGKGMDVGPASVRSGAAKAVREALRLKRRQLSVVAPEGPEADRMAEDALLGALLGAYRFDKFKSDKETLLGSLDLVAARIDRKGVARIRRTAEAVNYARDLVNDNASEIFPERLAREARTICRRGRMTCRVLTEKEIAAQGLGLLQAVGQASPYPPRLILMKYNGNPRSKKKVALVGKGITFDSGGQNLKPSGHIETMRLDMSGAAAVLGTMRALADLRPRVNVVGVIAAAHNAIGNGAYFPGDVYRSYAGKTVEIGNTDAEGRLVLGDAFAYVQQKEKPAEIIDLATLTGAVLVALGDTVAGVFSNDDRLANRLYAAGERTGERVWRLPVYDEHREAMKSEIADLKNTSKLRKGYAGSITGAAFLQAFVDKTPWAHVDIAGTAYNEGEARGEVPKFATGFGVRLLLDYLTL